MSTYSPTRTVPETRQHKNNTRIYFLLVTHGTDTVNVEHSIPDVQSVREQQEIVRDVGKNEKIGKK